MRRIVSTAGTTLVEVLVYLFVLTIISTAAISLLISLSSLFTQYTAKQQLYTTGTIVMERLLNDIREASELDTAQSIVASSTAARLVLDMGTTTTRYEWTGDNLDVWLDGVYGGTLNGDAVTVDAVWFDYIGADNKQLIRVRTELSITVGSYTEQAVFSGAAIIRGSYVQ